MMKYASLRGMILEFLHKVYPNMVLELDIVSVFYRDYKDTAIRKSIAYLVDKGYVERIEKEHPIKRYDRQVFYRLTPKGIDLLEGTIKDEAIAIDDRDGV